MKRSRGVITSAITRLIPTQITDKATGNIISWEDYQTVSLYPLLDWVRKDTLTLYGLNPERVHALALNLTGSANSYGRQNGYKANHMSLPREVKAKSRLGMLVYHKLMSETASYEKNPNPLKKLHSFSSTINLGAVDKQMCVLEREDHELVLSWACWDKEYELRFTLPRYVQERVITKFSLPLVSETGFIFSYQETPVPVQGPRIAGLDLGRVEPFSLVVLSERQKVIATYRASKQVTATNAKRERILAEVKQTRAKAEAREALGLDDTILREQVTNLRAKAKRIGVSISAQAGAEVGRIMARHEVSLLRLEDLSWAAGAKYGSKWAHSQAGIMITHSAQRHGAKVQKVSPRGTSQHCHACHTKITHNTKTRTVWCGDCKTRLDRDYNAALNIAKKQSFPVTSNRRNGSTCSGSPQSTGQSPTSQYLNALTTSKMLTTLEL